MLAPLIELVRATGKRTLPAHVGPAHYLGALALVAFALEVITGLLLMIYYRPVAGAAYASTAIIMDEVRLGWLVRSLHRWGSDLLILLALVHMMRVYFSRAYQSPRHVNWVIGICLIVLVMTAAFTGQLLPWDQHAYWNTDGARRTIVAIPVLGSVLLALFWGGWELGEEVLLRFYSFHVGILPWLIVVLLALHVILIWQFGITPPSRPSRSPPVVPTRFFPDFLTSLVLAVLLVGGLLFSVAILYPPPIFGPIDPLSPPAVPPSQWYTLPIRELLRRLDGGGAALALLGFFALLFLVPLLDRNPQLPLWKRALHLGLGSAVIAAWILLGLRGALR